MRASDSSIYRKHYAALVAVEGDAGPPIRAAFEAVPREAFLGPGPWLIKSDDGYERTPSDDPAPIYQDVVIALRPERQLNNGQPSLHARCLSAAGPRPGERVVQIGVGQGYYSAILAELVGPKGRIDAIELDRQLAVLATANLASYKQVKVHCRSGAEAPLPSCDLIYVCAGASAPLPLWLEALAPGGHLVFPLTPGWDYGAMLMITRELAGFAAQFLCPAQFIPCIGAQSAVAAEKLKTAFEAGGWHEVRSLQLGTSHDGAGIWFEGGSWRLSKQPLH